MVTFDSAFAEVYPLCKDGLYKEFFDIGLEAHGSTNDEESDMDDEEQDEDGDAAEEDKQGGPGEDNHEGLF